MSYAVAMSGPGMAYASAGSGQPIQNVIPPVPQIPQVPQQVPCFAAQPQAGFSAFLNPALSGPVANISPFPYSSSPSTYISGGVSPLIAPYGAAPTIGPAAAMYGSSYPMGAIIGGSAGAGVGGSTFGNGVQFGSQQGAGGTVGTAANTGSFTTPGIASILNLMNGINASLNQTQGATSFQSNDFQNAYNALFNPASAGYLGNASQQPMSPIGGANPMMAAMGGGAGGLSGAMGYNPYAGMSGMGGAGMSMLG